MNREKMAAVVLFRCVILTAHVVKSQKTGNDSLVRKGMQTFRFDTFGDESWWGDTLHLHQAIEGVKFGGIGPGIGPAAALSLGLKVDLDACATDPTGQRKLERSWRDSRSAQDQRSGGCDRAFQSRWQPEISRDSVCVVSFHGG